MPYVSLRGQPLGVKGLYGAGQALSAYGDYQSSRAEARSLSQSADAQRLMAADLDQIGDFDFRRALDERDAVLADIQNIYASAGVELEGAPMEVLAETARQIALDNLLIRRQYRQQAQEARVTASQLDEQAKAQRKAGTLDLIGNTATAALPFFL